MFTAEVIARMDKSQVAAALKLSGLLDAETISRLSARKDALNAPPARTPFPRQAELNEAYEQIRIWSDAAKGLIKEARDGGHTFQDSSGTVKGERRARGTAKSGNTTKRQAFTITANGTDYNSWREVADDLCARPDLPRDKTNWRKIVYRQPDISGTVTFTDSESFEYYNENFTDSKWEFVMA